MPIHVRSLIITISTTPLSVIASCYDTSQLKRQHTDLFLVVVLEGVLVALLQPAEADVDLRGPPDLGTGQRHLYRT